MLGRKFEIRETNVPKAGWEGKNQSPYPIQKVLVREMRQESVRWEKQLEFDLNGNLRVCWDEETGKSPSHRTGE